jgi:hypothetical protein
MGNEWSPMLGSGNEVVAIQTPRPGPRPNKPSTLRPSGTPDRDVNAMMALRGRVAGFARCWMSLHVGKIQGLKMSGQDGRPGEWLTSERFRDWSLSYSDGICCVPKKNAPYVPCAFQKESGRHAWPQKQNPPTDELGDFRQAPGKGGGNHQPAGRRTATNPNSRARRVSSDLKAMQIRPEDIGCGDRSQKRISQCPPQCDERRGLCVSVTYQTRVRLRASVPTAFSAPPLLGGPSESRQVVGIARCAVRVS